MKRGMLLSLAAVTIAAVLATADPAAADPPGYRGGPPPGRHYDRYYPPRGHVVHHLPPRHHVAYYGRYPYYYGGGVWYRPYGPYFSVIAPPIGISVSFLPSYYTTVWFGGVPYYYANSVYYARRTDGPGYVVVEPPAGASGRDDAPPAGDTGEDFFMYPREGQDEQTQARDRYECHRWAESQTGYDPSEPEGGVPSDEYATRRSDYLRAITACLDGRGYTVR